MVSIFFRVVGTEGKENALQVVKQMAGRVASSFGSAGTMELLELFETAGGVEEEELVDVTTSVVVLPLVVVAMTFLRLLRNRQLPTSQTRRRAALARTGIERERKTVGDERAWGGMGGRGLMGVGNPFVRVRICVLPRCSVESG